MPSGALHAGRLGVRERVNADGDQCQSLLQRSIAPASSHHVHPPPDLGDRCCGVDGVLGDVRSYRCDEPPSRDQLRDFHHLGLSGGVASASSQTGVRDPTQNTSYQSSMTQFVLQESDTGEP